MKVVLNPEFEYGMMQVTMARQDKKNIDAFSLLDLQIPGNGLPKVLDVKSIGSKFSDLKYVS
jgi:hypothetical protein